MNANITNYKIGGLSEAISAQSVAKRKKPKKRTTNAPANRIGKCRELNKKRTKKSSQETSCFSEALGIYQNIKGVEPQYIPRPKAILPKTNAENLFIGTASQRKRNFVIEDDSEEEDYVRPKKKKFTSIEEKNKNTIFIGNLPITVDKKEIIKLFQPFGKIEAVRIRSVAVCDPTVPRKVAVIRQDFHASRNNMNAYVRFETSSMAEEALKMNGKQVKGFHIKVDLAARNKVHDHKKSVFVGNLPFSVEEEALYSHFGDCGEVSSVRIIRDAKTGIGKGIGYVTFETSDAVYLALKLAGSQLAGRPIRVSRSAEQPSQMGDRFKGEKMQINKKQFSDKPAKSSFETKSSKKKYKKKNKFNKKNKSLMPENQTAGKVFKNKKQHSEKSPTMITKIKSSKPKLKYHENEVNKNKKASEVPEGKAKKKKIKISMQNL